MNYSIISFLEKRLTKDLSLFEYGSGFSTHFYSRLVGEVTSVEHDRAWYDRIRNELAPNVDLLYVAKDIDGAYCRTIHEFEGGFDVVIVDGRDRVNCVKQSLEKLSARGVIILDDSDRSRYSEGIEHALSHGFRALEFEGLKPTGIGAVVSTLFYRADNCLNL